MSLTTWEINGLNLELDIEDYNDNVKYRNAFAVMDKEEKALQKDGDRGEFIKRYCLMYYHLYDNIFGEGTGERIFNGKFNSRICDEIYDSFLGFVRAQTEEAQKRKSEFASRYTPNRAARRAKK